MDWGETIEDGPLEVSTKERFSDRAVGDERVGKGFELGRLGVEEVEGFLVMVKVGETLGLKVVSTSMEKEESSSRLAKQEK